MHQVRGTLASGLWLQRTNEVTNVPKSKSRRRGGRVAIAKQGERASNKSFTKWSQKMQREHPAEYAEAMRRLNGDQT